MSPFSTRCLICDEPFQAEEACFSTWGVFFKESDLLFPYCDGPMHWDCYADWPDRQRFARAYFDAWSRSASDNDRWSVVLSTCDALVQVNPDPPVETVSLTLAATGTIHRVLLSDWETWIVSAADEAPHPLVRDALGDELPGLRVKFPNADSLLDAIDWDRREELLLTRIRRRARRYEEEALRPKHHNKRCRILSRQGIACAWCWEEGTVELVDLRPDGKSYFQCGDCRRTFTLSEAQLSQSFGDAWIRALHPESAVPEEE